MKRIEAIAAGVFASGWLVFAPNAWPGLPAAACYAGGIALAVAAMLALARLHKEGLEGFGVRRPNAEHAKDAIALFGLLIIPAIALRLALPSFDSWYAGLYGLATLKSLYNMAFWVLPLALVFEELAVRGLVHSRAIAAAGNNAWTLAGIALFFALMHIGLAGYSPSLEFTAGAMLTILAYSLAISFLYQKTQSLVATGLFHFLLNYASAAQTYLHASEQLASETALWALWALVFAAAWKRNAALLSSFGAFAGKTKPIAWKSAAWLVALAAIPLAVNELAKWV
ncbi:MAG: CPBP family intramembrane glutamic endopeptidase [Candidatus Micrarchaeota archaeon]